MRKIMATLALGAGLALAAPQGAQAAPIGTDGLSAFDAGGWRSDATRGQRFGAGKQRRAAFINGVLGNLGLLGSGIGIVFGPGNVITVTIPGDSALGSCLLRGECGPFGGNGPVGAASAPAGLGLLGLAGLWAWRRRRHAV